jgi:ribosomal protein S18 acetylase RimI-like enzyme
MMVSVGMILRGYDDLPPGFLTAAHRLLSGLVRDGAALGWVAPPSFREISELVEEVSSASAAGDASLRAAYVDDHLVGLGYWLRYARPTHRPHADLEKVAVGRAWHGQGIGRALTETLIADARSARVEMLTLDARGDNLAAHGLYQSLGFTEYGRLHDFVAVGDRRWDKVFYVLDLRHDAT